MVCAGVASHAAEARERWVGAWACSPQLVEPNNRPPPPGLNGATLRQRVRVSLAGRNIRVRLSNAFGDTAVTLASVHIARAVNGSAIERESDHALTFGGLASVTIPAGAPIISDELFFPIAALSDVAITIHFRDTPRDITGHPGSRTTSYLQAGDFVAAPDLPEAARTDHWYFINGIDVRAEQPAAAAIVVLGDSITDGRGSTTNGNDRWPDRLARRLQSDPATAHIAVLNHGIGGNRLLRDGLGPNALARLDRDVLAQTGVRWLIVLEGVNDLGTAVGARAKNEPFASARDVIAGYEQIIARAHARGLLVYGATIMPFAGFGLYDRPESEADRQAVNTWIRTSGSFDAVIDFDAAVRDVDSPPHLAAAYDVGDHLHLNPAGYARMAEAIELTLFRD